MVNLAPNFMDFTDAILTALFICGIDINRVTESNVEWEYQNGLLLVCIYRPSIFSGFSE